MLTLYEKTFFPQENTFVYPLPTSLGTLCTAPRAEKQLQNTVGTVTMKHCHHKTEQSKKKQNIPIISLCLGQERAVQASSCVVYRESFGLSVR